MIQDCVTFYGILYDPLEFRTSYYLGMARALITLILASNFLKRTKRRDVIWYYYITMGTWTRTYTHTHTYTGSVGKSAEPHQPSIFKIRFSIRPSIIFLSCECVFTSVNKRIRVFVYRLNVRFKFLLIIFLRLFIYLDLSFYVSVTMSKAKG